MNIRDYTTIEQSKKLLELGLSKDTANMVYPCSIVRGKENGFLNAIFKESILYAMHTTIEEKEKSIPCWSLGALLKIMPDNFVELLKEGGMYRVKAEQKYVSCLAENPIDVVCEMVINLLEKGYIKKEK